MEQLQLLLRDSKKEVALEVIITCQTFKDSLKLCFMAICGNKVPLIWLAYKTGYTLHPLKTELELENDRLRAELDESRKEIEILTKYKKAGII